ncbi:MAG TPA: divalent metal cation transporter [Alphaproteobacteria bacterium]|jgi:NRAMP (natural resistance-associated macrophage protein)-like metal ion transporter|nr:divalent metal cation transporter [Alphaproteobacteria bacterium]
MSSLEARRAVAAKVKEPEKPKLLQVLGPGLITGASDDDPSGIATYSQAGAQYGYQMGWTLLFSYPLMVAIQMISARIGRVTGLGIAGNLKRHYPAVLLYGIVSLLVVANTINLAADLGAMGAAVKLLVGGPSLAYVAGFALLSAGLEIYARYSRYVNILKWLSLSLLAYVATVLVAGVSWRETARGLIPHFSADGSSLTVVVAILGTTISPYLFFWQANVEVEDEKEDPQMHPLKTSPEQAPAELGRITLDTVVGMGVSNLVALFIILSTAATLHAHGVTDIQTSADAAKALEPIAGRFAFAVFALGIIGTGILALPVLAGSAAFAVGEVFGWPVGLARRPDKAKAFYATIAGATAIGALLNFTPLDPVKALFWSAVINGVVAVPVMVLIMLIATKRAVMGKFILPPALKWGGWIATVVMAAAAVGMFATWGK